MTIQEWNRFQDSCINQTYRKEEWVFQPRIEEEENRAALRTFYQRNAGVTGRPFRKMRI